MKRLMDISVALLALLLACPILALFCMLIFLQDFKSPIYISNRVGLGGRLFKMYKLRSMISGADKSGVASTAGDDLRITPIGQIVRRLKLDELVQLVNVLKGDMSLVGPRPNVKSETELYTTYEQRLLSVRPGITDFASIVFSDEAEILKGSSDPDKDYNRLIRPLKSELGIFYIETANFLVDLFLCFTTVVAIVNREKSLKLLAWMLMARGAPARVVEESRRQSPLKPRLPPEE